MLSHFSHVWLFVTLWTVATRLPFSWDAPGKNTQVDCLALLPGFFPTQGLNPLLLCLLCWQGSCLPLESPGKPVSHFPFLKKKCPLNSPYTSLFILVCGGHDTLNFGRYTFKSIKNLNWKSTSIPAFPDAHENFLDLSMMTTEINLCVQPVNPKGNQPWVFIGRTHGRSWNSNTLATWWEELTHLKRPWCWERLKAGGEGDDRGWDGWMPSPTQQTWVWVSSQSWWWTGREARSAAVHGVAKSQDMTEQLNWTDGGKGTVMWGLYK